VIRIRPWNGLQLISKKKTFGESTKRLNHDAIEIAARASDRPETTPVVARRMITSILGVKADISPAQKEREDKQFEDARGSVAFLISCLATLWS